MKIDFDWLNVTSRFPFSKTIEKAMHEYPDRNIIVFCDGVIRGKVIQKIKDNHVIKSYVAHQGKFTLDDGKVIIIMNSYHKARGYERNMFVVVNHLKGVDHGI